MRTRRDWKRSSWTRPTGTERLRLGTLHEFLYDQLGQNPEAETVTFRVDELREVLDATRPELGIRGAAVRDEERGVTYRVVLDTATKPGEARLESVEIIRDRIGPGIEGWTTKGGEMRRKGKAGTYLAPYDEGVFRVPVQEIAAQALAALEWADSNRSEDGSHGIVIGARSLAPPTPEQLREHLREGMTVQQIAERYERKPRMVYGWLAAARKATPKLKWPEVKHRPTQTADRAKPPTRSSAGNEKEESKE